MDFSDTDRFKMFHRGKLLVHHFQRSFIIGENPFSYIDHGHLIENFVFCKSHFLLSMVVKRPRDQNPAKCKHLWWTIKVKDVFKKIRLLSFRAVL